ncbi:MAG: ComEC/Rec2 family competence protein [bacterium]
MKQAPGFTPVERFLYHPLFSFLLGGMGSVGLIRYILSPVTFPYLLTGSVIILIGTLLITFRRDFPVCLLLICAGFGLFGFYSMVRRYPYLQKRSWLSQSTVHVSGEYHPPNTLFIQSVNNTSTTGRLFLNKRDLGKKLDHSGEHDIRLTGTVKWPHSSQGFSDYLESRRYLGTLSVKRIHHLEPIKARGFGVYRSIQNFFNKTRTIWPISTGFLEALVLGNKGRIPDFILELLRRLGLSHLFVISGLHVGMIYLPIRHTFRKMGKKPLFIATLVGLGAYLFFLGWPISALRAAIMILVLAFMDFSNRDRNLVSPLLVTVLIFMIWNPFVIFDVGFQLTCSAVTGIILFSVYEPYLEKIPLGQLLCVSLGAFFGVMPVVLFHFHYVPVFGVVTGWIGTYLFPLFVLTVLSQWVFMAIPVPSIAIEMERFFHWIVFSLEAQIEQFRWILTVSDVSLLAIVILVFGLVGIVQYRRKLWLGLGIVTVIFFFLGMAMPPVQSHVEIKTVDDVPVVFVYTPAYESVVYVPPRIELNSYVVYRIGQELKKRGIRHVDFFISDYRRDTFWRMRPEFTVENHLVHWREESTVQWRHGAYDFERKQLLIPGRTISFNALKGTEKGVYDPRQFVGYTPKHCLVNDISLLNDEEYQRLQRKPCEVVLLREKSLKYQRGRVVSADSSFTKSVRENLQDLVVRMTKGWV